MTILTEDLQSKNEVTVETREVFPSHFLLKIESFSLLSVNDIEFYESTEFEVEGFKWRLIIYPNGQDSLNDTGYVSVNLAVANPISLPARWEINARFSIFLHNQKSDNFLSVQGKARRFHAQKTEWGFSKFISDKSFKDPSNGYLVNDNCVFGAEVFVIKNQRLTESLSLSSKATTFHRCFRIERFSKIENVWTSENFIHHDQNWMISVYPRGEGDHKGLSIFLRLVDLKRPYQKVKLDFSILLKDQIKSNHQVKHIRMDWLLSENSRGKGWYEFMSIDDMKDPEKGFVVKDCCIIVVEISMLAVAKTLP